jgi:hypothetical protein
MHGLMWRGLETFGVFSDARQSSTLQKSAGSFLVKYSQRFKYNDMNNQTKPQLIILPRTHKLSVCMIVRDEKRFFPIVLEVCKVLLSQALRLVFRGYDLAMQHCDQAVELVVKV